MSASVLEQRLPRTGSLVWPSALADRLSKWSLARQFLVVHFAIMLSGLLVTGVWIGNQIEATVLERTAGVTAIYVNSVIAPRLQSLAWSSQLTEAELTELDNLVNKDGLGQGVVVFKIWSPDARILYSPERSRVGQSFPIMGGLTTALAGQVTAEMSDLDEPENEIERARWGRLLEVYAPVRRERDGKLIAVSEFYLEPDALEAEIGDARLRAWLLVGAFGAVLYLLTAGIVKRGSDTIERQRKRLQHQVLELATLHERVLQSASRTTALNEQALRRISADLHDGPAQVLALALMRMEVLRAQSPDSTDFGVVHDAMQDALKDVRAISSGLRLPELAPLTLAQVLDQAVSDHERRTRTFVTRHFAALPEQAPLAVKIALVRTVQEALSNATRHAANAGVAVYARVQEGRLCLEVSDQGPGFDPTAEVPSGHLGLAGMRERAELLGGRFEVESAPGAGVTVRACWPLVEHIRS